MKKILSLLSLAALTIGLLGSCSKMNERIDNLEKKVDGIENNQIATIGQQIATINQSIADLSTIRTNIQTLMDAKTAMGEDITKLKAADQTLEGKINDLKTYVDKELTKYATKDWANATFATLATQTEIITDVEKLKTDLAGLDNKLDQAIANLDSSLKGWVNEQLSGYYTIAQVDAKVDGIQSDIDALKADNETNKTDIEKLEADLAKLTPDLATAKNEIKAAYEKAISDAISGNNGYINSTIKNAIDAANANITALTGRVAALESDVATLKNDVAALKAMIQTVSIIPAYSNGSLKAEDGILTINCVITPKEAVESLKKANFTILTSESEVLTKSALYGTLKIAKDEDLVLDKTNGTATIKVNVSSVLPTEEDKALTVAVNIKNGISDFTTEFVPVYVYVAPAPVAPEGFVDLGVKDANGKPLYWAEKNLGATNPEDYGKYFSWGDVTGQTLSGSTFSKQFSWDNDVFGQLFNKVAQTTACPDGVLAQTYDVAYQTNNAWRMPTTEDFVELFKQCYAEWGTYNSVDGLIVYKAKEGDAGYAYFNSKMKQYSGSENSWTDATSKTKPSYSTSNDTFIFFPAAGYGMNIKTSNAGSGGFYWSSTLYSDKTTQAYLLYFDSANVSPQDYYYRFYGYSVRPVSD